MTKARARERAKKKALEKTKKRLAHADQPVQATRPGQYDPGSSSIKGLNVNTNNSSSMRRGAARSK
ncbi:MAG: hypothetical protein HON65_10675 [Rhodospirillales bacterium]|jgi:hypothetical protein|nr:hypothetical protein [Rhodospirillales bacterium]